MECFFSLYLECTEVENDTVLISEVRQMQHPKPVFCVFISWHTNNFGVQAYILSCVSALTSMNGS